MAKNKKKADDSHALAMRRFEIADEADRDNRNEAEEDLRFLIGDQWDADIIKARKAEYRPTLTVNRMPQFMRQIANDIRMSKPSMKIKAGDDKTDTGKAEIIEGLVRSIERSSDSQSAYYMAADSQVACGIGHWRVTTDYINEWTLDQEIIIEPIEDGLNVLWDPSAIKQNREDAGYCFVPVDMARDEFKEKYPSATVADFTASGTTSTQTSWDTEDTIRVAEYWFKKPTTREFLILQDGTTVIAEELEETARAELEDLGTIEKTVTRETFKIYRALLTQSEFLEGPEERPGRHIPIVPVVGEEVRIGKKVHRRGALRFARDPQRIYNYWTTANTEFVALQPIAPFIGTAKNFENNLDQWETANKTPHAFLEYEPDQLNGGQPPHRPPPPSASAGMLEGLAQASDDMKATTGIYDAGLGSRSNETSGKAIIARQQEGDISTYVYMDNFTRAIKRTGEIIVDMIPHYYDNARVVAILGPDGKEAMIPVNQAVQTAEGGEAVNFDLTVGRYDIAIEGGPSFTTRRQEAAAGMESLIQSNPALFEVIGDVYVKAQDWPMANDIAERIQKLQRVNHPYLFEGEDGEQPQEPQPNPAEEAMMALEIEGKKASITETEAKAAKAQAEAMKTEAETAGAVLSYPSGEETFLRGEF